MAASLRSFVLGQANRMLGGNRHICVLRRVAEKRVNEFSDGVSRIRLIVERRRSGARTEYVLSEAGEALAPTVESLALWSKHWLPATLSTDRADPDLVMWDMHRRMNLDRMPPSRTVIQFEFTDQPEIRRLRWIVGKADSVELCITDPGFDVDLFVETDSRTVTLVWYGDMPLGRAIEAGAIDLHGPRHLCDAFPSWLQLNLLAEVPRRRS